MMRTKTCVPKQLHIQFRYILIHLCQSNSMVVNLRVKLRTMRAKTYLMFAHVTAGAQKLFEFYFRDFLKNHL